MPLSYSSLRLCLWLCLCLCAHLQEERATPRFENPEDAPIQEKEALEIFVKAIKELFSVRRQLPMNVVRATHDLLVGLCQHRPSYVLWWRCALSSGALSEL